MGKIIKDKKSAIAFIEALEYAQGRRKRVVINEPVETIEDKETIKKLFL